MFNVCFLRGNFLRRISHGKFTWKTYMEKFSEEELEGGIPQGEIYRVEVLLIP